MITLSNKLVTIAFLLFLSPLAMAEGGSPGISSFIPLVALMVIFYFLLIRPQQKRAKEHKTLLTDLKVDDEVLSNGGILAKITKIDDADSFMMVEIAKGIEVKVQKQSINQRMPKGTL